MTEINQFDPTILTSSSFQFGAQNIQPEEIKTTINGHNIETIKKIQKLDKIQSTLLLLTFQK